MHSIRGGFSASLSTHTKSGSSIDHDVSNDFLALAHCASRFGMEKAALLGSAGTLTAPAAAAALAADEEEEEEEEEEGGAGRGETSHSSTSSSESIYSQRSMKMASPVWTRPSEINTFR